MKPRSDLNVDWRQSPEDEVPIAMFLATQPEIGLEGYGIVDTPRSC